MNNNENDDILIIAEVGQNHQGDIDNALEYIKVFSEAGANVIKFQTRDNKTLFSEDAYNKEYNSTNAFAKFYGQHREALELSVEKLHLLKEECQKFGVKFMSTPFDEPSLDRLIEVGVDMIKIASFDLGNLPFLQKISTKGIPVVMSTGGGDESQIRESIEILKKGIDNLSVLHCVSEYPCPHDRLGLESIPHLIQNYPECKIGISDHFNGTLSGPVSYMLGARVFEKHVTLNRAWKGTDHAFSLEPHGFRNMVRDIRRVPEMMPRKKDNTLGKEPVFIKLGKSIIASRDLEVGHEIALNDLSGKIFSEQYVPVRESKNFIGIKLKVAKKRGELINYSDIS